MIEYKTSTAFLRIDDRVCVSKVTISGDRCCARSGVTICESPLRATATSSGDEERRSCGRQSQSVIQGTDFLLAECLIAPSSID